MVDEPVIGLDAELRIDQFERSLAAYQAALDSATDATANAADRINEAGDVAETASTGVNSLGVAFSAGLGAAIGEKLLPVLENAIKSIWNFTDAAAEEETGIARLRAAVIASGADWEVAGGQIEQYISTQQRRTALDDGEARDALVQLVTITGNYETSLSLLSTAMDMSAARGQSLSSTAMVLGRVAEGNVSILRRYGVVVDENTSATEALRLVSEKFAGQAEAMGNTAAGAGERMDVAFGNVKESLGSPFLGAIAAAKSGIADLVTSLLPAVDAISSSLGAAFDESRRQIGVALSDIADSLGWSTDSMADTAYSGGAAIGAGIAEGISSALPYVIGAIQAIGDVISWWLEPASPPEVAPDVDEWGAELVYIYADGISSAADSDVVRSAVSDVQTALAAAFNVAPIGTDLDDASFNSAAKAQRNLVMQMASTPEKITMVESELAALAVGTDDYYTKLSELYGLEQDYAAEQQAMADAQARAAEEAARAEQKRQDEMADAQARAEEEAARAAAAAAEEAARATEDAAKAEEDRQRTQQEAADAEWDYQYAMADTADKLLMQKDRLADLDDSSAEYYRTQAAIYELEQRRTAELQALADEQAAAAKKQIDASTELADAEWDYQYAIANTAGKLQMQKDRLTALDSTSVEYYQTQATIYELEQRRTAELQALADEQAALADEQAAAAKEQVDAKADLEDAEWAYQYAIADTPTKLQMQRDKLAALDTTSVEYFQTKTAIYELEQQLLAEQERTTGATDRAAASMRNSEAAAKAAARAAEQLADAQFRYQLSTASAAEKVDLLRARLATLEPGTVEWFNTATQLAQAEEALAKGAGGAGEAVLGLGEDLETAGEGVEKLDLAGRIAAMFDPKKIKEQAETIRTSITTTLKPIFESSGGNLAKFLGDGFRTAIATALFGPETVTQLQQVSPGEWIPEQVYVGNDASWTEIRNEIGERISNTLTDVMVSLGIDPTLARLMGDNWIAILVTTLIANSPLVSHLLGTAIGGLLAKAVGYAVIGGAGLIKGATTGLANWLWLNVGTALESAFGTGMAGLGATLTGLTLATLLPVIFPEETTNLVDAAYLWCNEHIAQPIQGWFSNELPGIISGLPPIFNSESQQWEPVKWQDVLDETGLVDLWTRIGTAWSEGASRVIITWNDAYADVQATAVAWLADMGINADDIWLIITTGWAKIRDSVTTSWNDAHSGVGITSSEWYADISQWADDTWLDVTSTWETIKDDVSLYWTQAWEGVSATCVTWFAYMLQWDDLTWQDVTDTWAAIKNDVSLYWSQAWAAVSTTATTWYTGIVVWGDSVWTDLTSTWTAIKNDLTLAWTQTRDGVIATANTWWQQLSTWGDNVWTDLTSTWSAIKNDVTLTWTQAKDDVTAKAAAWWQQLKTWADNVWTDLTGVWTAIKNDLTLAWTNTKDSVMGAANTWWGELSMWASNVWLTVTTRWNEIRAGIYSAMDGAVNDSAGRVNALKDFLGNTWGAITKGFNDAKQGLIDAMVGPFQAAYDAIMDILNKIPGVPSPTPYEGGGGEEGGSGTYATGTPQTRAGVAVVGEWGPELVQFPAGARVFSTQESAGVLGEFLNSLPARMAGLLLDSAGQALAYTGVVQTSVAPGTGGASRAGGVVVNVGPVTVANGMDEARFTAMVRRAVADAL